MNKKLCKFLDVMYFLSTFFIIYLILSMYILPLLEFDNLKEVYFTVFQVEKMLIVSFTLLLTFLLDFSFISKVLTYFKFSKKAQTVVFIILLFAVIFCGFIIF